MTRHFLRDDDLTPPEQSQVLELAAQVKRDPNSHSELAGKAVAVLFDKASTRTRVSFEVGIYELGGYPVIMDTNRTQMGRGEPIADAARVLGRQVAAVVWRTFAQQNLIEMAAFAQVPVVNALTDSFHPCQLLADLQTVAERFSTCAGLTVGVLGDGASNTAQSWLLAAATAGMHVRIGTPDGYQPDPEVVAAAEKIARACGGSVQVLSDPLAAADGAQVITTDTWVSMGQSDPDGVREQSFQPYQVNDAVMAVAAPEAILLHCLPAYRGKEVSAAVLDGPQSCVWQQAENRRHAQKALLITLLGRLL